MKIYERRVFVSVILSAIGLTRLLFRIEINFVCISESLDEGRVEGRVHNVWERWSEVTTIRMSSDANMDFPNMQIEDAK